MSRGTPSALPVAAEESASAAAAGRGGPADPSTPSYSAGEEMSHAVSHGVGFVLAVVGVAILVVLASQRGSVWHVATSAVFGASLILLYIASTLYHSIPHQRAKHTLRILDHVAIYLLIAGTYTPFTLVSLRGPLGWSLFAVVWAGAIGGILAKTLAFGRGRILSVVAYIAMGWCAVVALGPLRAAIGTGGLTLLVAGGIAYTLGVVFYGWKSLRFHHLIWHLFVLTGSVLHYLAVLLHVIPRPG